MLVFSLCPLHAPFWSVWQQHDSVCASHQVCVRKYICLLAPENMLCTLQATFRSHYPLKGKTRSILFVNNLFNESYTDLSDTYAIQQAPLHLKLIVHIPHSEQMPHCFLMASNILFESSQAQSFAMEV